MIAIHSHSVRVYFGGSVVPPVRLEESLSCVWGQQLVRSSTFAILEQLTLARLPNNSKSVEHLQASKAQDEPEDKMDVLQLPRMASEPFSQLLTREPWNKRERLFAWP